MRTQRRQATTGLVVLALLLGSLWAGAVAGAGTAPDRLTASRAGLGVEATAPPDRAPALRPAVQRPDPAGRPLPLLLGLLPTALAAAWGLRAWRRRSDPAPVRSPARSSRREARAPPSLQPA